MRVAAPTVVHGVNILMLIATATFALVNVLASNILQNVSF